jgi:2-polyprenyl-3-methyl-5-hydroxy-6-metoxy-1,4-benzoquinol methylase
MSDTVKSPITGSANVKKIDELNEDFFVKNYQQKYGLNVSRFFSEHKKIGVYQCLDSHYIFYYPFVVGDSAFYEDLEKFDWYYKTEKWDYDFSEKYIKDGSEVLEIGSGFGFFLKKLRAKNCITESVELNQSAAKKLEEEGFTVHCTAFEDFSAANPDKKYDYICAFQLMEHIPNVGDFLSLYAKHLKPGGKLIIGVPNNKSILLSYKSNTLNLPPHHAGLWTEEFFAKIPSIFPEFTLEGVHYEPIDLNKRIKSGVFYSKEKHASKSAGFFLSLPLNLFKGLSADSKNISMHIIGILTKK